ncbi:Transcription factor TFIIIB component B'' [Chionoecetes opilio]|uniref:Transcription factor TFIIIB component B n=1 Tax=Chionoecetes opilio TaxID=41210 RepID=A0A8J4YQN2_CHIOP|nr:Transcription factor TFIIIB component B'' [Chionoecetes opilio]
MAKQERIPKETSSVISQKTKTKTPIHVSKLCGKLGKKIKLEDVADSPDRVKKQIFRARKNQFRKKMSEGGMEHSKMTMFDLIYWNPASNPMPGSTSSPKRNAQSTSKDDTDSITSEAAEEQRVDDLGLVDPLEIESDHAIISSPGSPEVVKIKEQDSENPQEESKDPLEEEKEPGEGSATNEDGEKVKDIFAPRVKIGPNGEIIVDEQSIKIQTTAAKNRDEVLSKAVVVEEIGDSSYYGKWSKRRKRSYEWTVKETALFYKALSTVGTDFSLMEILIKWRTRAELKTKFKKEERNNRDTVDRALNDSTQFDMTVFEEETDYDPKEDRKAARQAERAEAKRRRMAMKQEDKIKKMELKKLETKKIKTEVKSRKKLLRKIYRNRGRKRKEPEIVESDNEESPLVYESDSGVDEAALEESPPQDKVTVKARVMPKREAKRRNSLVISEVTVTVETVKYDKPASEVLIERTVREHEAEPEVARPSQGEEASTEECEGPQEEAHPSLSPEHITAHHTDELIAREEQDHEMILLDEYSELPLSEGLPENFIIGMLTENDENNSNNEDEMVDVETLDASTSEDDGTAADLQPGGLVPEPYDEEQRVWHFPVSAIQTLEDGQQVIVVPTDNGHYSVPVPILPPGTSKLVVMATDVPDSPGELIYHVYVVSPLEAGES